MLNFEMSGEGPDLIFLHGWGGSKDSFCGLASALSSEYRVTLVDFYGFGKSPHPDEPLRLDDFAAGIKEIVARFGMGGVTLIGHSFGGRVAIRLARKYPHLADGLVLIDSAGMKPRRNLKYYRRVLAYKIGKLLGKSRGGSPDYLALDGARKKTFVNIISEYLDYELRYVSVPALILWGEDDGETPLYMGKRLKKRLKISEFRSFSGAGHFSYLDRPSETLAAIKNFLGRIYD